MLQCYVYGKLLGFRLAHLLSNAGTVSQINTIGQLDRHRLAVDLDPENWRIIPNTLKSKGGGVDLIINRCHRSIIDHDCTGEICVAWYGYGNG